MFLCSFFVGIAAAVFVVIMWQRVIQWWRYNGCCVLALFLSVSLIHTHTENDLARTNTTVVNIIYINIDHDICLCLFNRSLSWMVGGNCVSEMAKYTHTLTYAMEFFCIFIWKWNTCCCCSTVRLPVVPLLLLLFLLHSNQLSPVLWQKLRMWPTERSNEWNVGHTVVVKESESTKAI